MLKIVKFLGVCVVLFALFACSGTKGVKLTKIEKCNFPQTNEKAPLWVCGADVEDIAIKGVGIVVKSKASANLARQIAAANARVLIAQELQTDIISKVSENISSKNSDGQEHVSEASKFVSEQITSASLIGAKVYREVYSKDGTLYTLVGLSEENYKKTLKNIEDKAQQGSGLSQTTKDAFAIIR